MSAELFWIIEHDGDTLHTLQTTDGGRTWEKWRGSLPSDWQRIRQIQFIDRDHGWIALNHSRDDELRLIATSDGGRNWQAVSTPTLRSADWWPEVIRLVSDSVGFIFVTGDGDPSSWDGLSHGLLYTADGGIRWQRHPLPYAIRSCQAVERDIVCAAVGKATHFGTLRIHLVE